MQNKSTRKHIHSKVAPLQERQGLGVVTNIGCMLEDRDDIFPEYNVLSGDGVRVTGDVDNVRGRDRGDTEAVAAAVQRPDCLDAFLSRVCLQYRLCMRGRKIVCEGWRKGDS